MAKKRGLGKGLGALLEGAREQAEASSDSDLPVSEDQKSEQAQTLADINVQHIQPGRYQPRQDMTPQALEELASSIRQQGMIQPIVLRPISAERYEIIAGERRWRAAQIAGMASIPAVVRDVPDDMAVVMALVENLQRENLGPVESALAFKRLQDEFELTQQEVADTVGKSRSSIANLLRLLQLTPEVRTMLERGDLEMGHARAILSLEETLQTEAAHHVISKGLSVRQTETMVRKLKSDPPSKKVRKKNISDPDIVKLEEKLAERLCAPVRMQHNASGKGKLVIQYTNINELDGILSHIK